MHSQLNIKKEMLKKAATIKKTRIICPGDNTIISLPPILGIPFPKKYINIQVKVKVIF